YGAFEIVGYQTFTTEIFTEINVAYSLPAASALSLVLVLLSLLVLAGEGMARGKGRVSRSGALTQRISPPQRLGAARPAVLAGFALLTGLALGVPIGASVYWMVSGMPPAITGVAMLAAAALATLMALPVALLAVRHAGRARQFLERSTYIVLALPGVVIALALGYFTEHYAGGLGYQTAPLLVLAYAIMFFPLALVGVKASLARA